MPFMDLTRQYGQLKEEIRAALDAVFDDGSFASGRFTQQFEEAFADYCGSSHAVGVNSGTSALHLALLTLGVGPGDEVIMAANTFIATAWAPLYVGAKPVFIDCDQYYNIDVEKVEAAINRRTKAIIGVHIYGHPCDVDALQRIADKHGLELIEDAAQAHGARYKGRRVGGLASLGCFSFYPSKNLGAAGEGGAVVTNDASRFRHLQQLRNQGAVKPHHYAEVGYNMRMDGIHGAILELKLQHLDRWNIRRRLIASGYAQRVSNARIQLPKVALTVEHAYHLYVVIVDERSRFLQHLTDHHVSFGLHYPVPCHLQKAFDRLGYQKGDFPQTEELSERCVSLPIFPELTREEIDHVIEVLNTYT